MIRAAPGLIVVVYVINPFSSLCQGQESALQSSGLSQSIRERILLMLLCLVSLLAIFIWRSPGQLVISSQASLRFVQLHRHAIQFILNPEGTCRLVFNALFNHGCHPLQIRFLDPL